MRPTRSFLSLRRVEHGRARFERARIDAAEGERADEGVVHDLEGEHGERLGRRAACARSPRRSRTSMPLIAGAIERRRQIVDDGVEQRLHALVLERRAAEHRDEGDRVAPPCGCSRFSVVDRPAPCRRDRPPCASSSSSTAASISAARYSLALLEQVGGNFLVVILRAESLRPPRRPPSCGRDRRCP